MGDHYQIGSMPIVIVSAPMPRKRKLRERLFSRPWRPFQVWQTVTDPMWDKVKDGNIVTKYGVALMSERTHYQYILEMELRESRRL